MVARFYQKNWAICNPIKTNTWHEIIRVKISQKRSFVSLYLRGDPCLILIANPMNRPPSGDTTALNLQKLFGR